MLEPKIVDSLSGVGTAAPEILSHVAPPEILSHVAPPEILSHMAQEIPFLE
jgi:hypothetical protein